MQEALLRPGWATCRRRAGPCQPQAILLAGELSRPCVCQHPRVPQVAQSGQGAELEPLGTTSCIQPTRCPVPAHASQPPTPRYRRPPLHCHAMPLPNASQSACLLIQIQLLHTGDSVQAQDQTQSTDSESLCEGGLGLAVTWSILSSLLLLLLLRLRPGCMCALASCAVLGPVGHLALAAANAKQPDTEEGGACDQQDLRGWRAVAGQQAPGQAQFSTGLRCRGSQPTTCLSLRPTCSTGILAGSAAA